MKAISLAEEGMIAKEDARLRALVQDVLARAKALGATDAEVDAGVTQGFSVSARMGDVEHVEFNRDKSIDISVYFGKRSGSASTTDISDSALQQAVEAACHIAKFTDEDDFSGLADPKYFATDFPDLSLYHPWELTPQEASQMAVDCEKQALSQDKHLTNSEGVDVYTSQGVYLYGNSRGFIGGYPTSRHGMSCVLIAEKDGNKERDYEYTCARSHLDLMATDTLAINAAERTLARLDSQKIKTQKAPVVFAAEVASSVIKYFLSAISGSNQYRKTSFLTDYIDKQVFPDFINIVEDPFVKKAFGSASFDNDGVACNKKHFIKNGVLKSYMLSVYSARKLGLVPTGNSGGVHNLSISHNDDDLADLLKKMGTGFLVTETMGNGVSIVTGDYSQGAAGFWVESGVIQYPVSGVTIAANLKDMFMGILSVAGDVDRRRNVLTGSILINEMTIAGA